MRLETEAKIFRLAFIWGNALLCQIIGLSFALALVGCELTNDVPPVTPRMAAYRPVGPQDLHLMKLQQGRVLFVHRCIECHTLPPLWHYSTEDWPEIVSSMSHRASLKPPEREAVLSYILAVRSKH
jgi:hypothetical protein